MRRLATNGGKSFVRVYDYPSRQATLGAHKGVQAAAPAAASVLFAHATGFHGRVFDKTISLLDPARFSCYSFDQRGHGQSPWPTGESSLEDWDGFGADAAAVGRYVKQQHPHTGHGEVAGGVVGVGHSMGATSLLLAALQEPQLFSALVVYEPVIFPPLWVALSKAFALFSESPLALSSRKRRLQFPSVQAAVQNFASKPPMNNFQLDVLHDYVRHGTALVETEGETAGGDADGQALRLLCDPNIEVSYK